MFFYISKLFAFLLMPYTQMVIWFILALVLRSKVWRRNFFILGMIYLAFFSNRFIVNEALVIWEIPPTPIESLDSTYGAGIVLGGMINSLREPRDRIYFYRGVDRINHTIQLYKAGIIRKILVTGGSGSLAHPEVKEALDMHRYLLMCGVRDQDIFVEGNSRNTHENALYSSRILEEKNLHSEKHLVITSAYHLRRALQCFEKTGLNVDGFSTDFYGHHRELRPDHLFIPDPSAFADWHLIVRELAGLLFYKMAGYI
jgi:uncharacterized SAM-binding protein YcdF (DUF218 family)